MAFGIGVVLAAATIASAQDADVEKVLRQLAKEVKPQQLGPLGIVNATASGRRFTINMASRPGADQALLMQHWQRADWSALCKKLPLRQAMVQLGATITVNWPQPGNQPPLTVDMTAERCKAIDQANPAPVVASVNGRPPFEFKGVRTTDTAASQFEKWSEMHGPPCRQEKDETICSFRDQEVSGVMFYIAARFKKDGPLVSITGSTSQIAAYSVVYEALTQKYGSPSSAYETEFVNGYGIRTKYPAFRWRFADGVLQLEHEVGWPKSRLRMQFTFISLDTLREMERAAPKPKVDF